MVDAHMSISNKLVHPSIAIVKIAAMRRKMLMSLKRLLMLTTASEKYCKFCMKMEKTKVEKNCAKSGLFQWKSFL